MSQRIPNDHIAEGPVMRESHTVPYQIVLREIKDGEGNVREYVIHYHQVEGGGYFWGHYFAASQRKEAYLKWAEKVHYLIANNLLNNVEF